MASIAYITDHKMIEFHRLHGNTSLIFWRPTSQKRFSYFTYGDYLFFLAKGSEKGKRREKGIVGYGKFTKEYIVEFDEMWRRFKTLTGYADKAALYDAILKVAKNHQLPEKMHCLKLEQVVFFQTPIYLSELYVSISKQVESYIYLDQEDLSISSKVIQLAAAYGQDLWTSVVLNQKEIFHNDAIICMLQNIHAMHSTLIYTDYERNKIMSFAKSCMMNKQSSFITPGIDDFYIMNQNVLEVYIPCISSMLSFDRNLMYCIGKYQMYSAGISQIKQKVQVVIVFDQDIEKKWKELLDASGMIYKIHAH